MSNHAPTLEEFETIAWRAYERLPKPFRDATGDIAFRIEDFADPETLGQMGIRSRYDLLGLYHGVDLTRQSTLDIRSGPDMVFLYREPILRYGQEEGVGLEAVIAHVLIHEIGHHFGLSDADMEAIEAENRRG